MIFLTRGVRIFILERVFQPHSGRKVIQPQTNKSYRSLRLPGLDRDLASVGKSWVLEIMSSSRACLALAAGVLAASFTACSSP